jgi:hypothetical protein
MSDEFRTLQFPSTPTGQAQKVKALASASNEGWIVVSENIIPGKFKGKKACCLFVIFAPCAFFAGHKDDIIQVTLKRTVDLEAQRVSVTGARLPPRAGVGDRHAPADKSPKTDEASEVAAKYERGTFADEFRKLAELKKDGLLSDEEFADMKAALIARAKRGMR